MTDPMVAPQEEQPSRPARNRSRDVRLVLTGIAAVLLVWFALANLQDVKIRYWLTSSRAPLIVVIVISGLLGAALAGLVSRMARRRRRTDDEG
jgi:uncharacterized integral membrane protein